MTASSAATAVRMLSARRAPLARRAATRYFATASGAGRGQKRSASQACRRRLGMGLDRERPNGRDGQVQGEGRQATPTARSAACSNRAARSGSRIRRESPDQQTDAVESITASAPKPRSDRLPVSMAAKTAIEPTMPLRMIDSKEPESLPEVPGARASAQERVASSVDAQLHCLRWTVVRLPSWVSRSQRRSAKDPGPPSAGACRAVRT